jgi:mannose-6-phosphate isomerase-like protein (cupin superfamily)
MPTDFPISHVDDAAVVMAPDGSTVRVLLAATRGSMARFELDPGSTSRAVRHRIVEELWYVISGHGEMWRSRDGAQTVHPLRRDTCLAIAPGTAFQFRAHGDETLIVVGATMPPWPGDTEAELVEGCPDWSPPLR